MRGVLLRHNYIFIPSWHGLAVGRNRYA